MRTWIRRRVAAALLGALPLALAACGSGAAATISPLCSHLDAVESAAVASHSQQLVGAAFATRLAGIEANLEADLRALPSGNSSAEGSALSSLIAGVDRWRQAAVAGDQISAYAAQSAVVAGLAGMIVYCPGLTPSGGGGGS